MVMEELRLWLCDRFGCEPEDVRFSASFDDLNIRPGELAELAFWMQERFSVEIPDDVLSDCETVEDRVGYVEDRL